MADEVDLLEVGRAVGDPGAREQRVDRTADLLEGGVDRRLLPEVDVDRLDPVELHLGEVHDHGLGTGVPHELGRSRTHAGRTADDQRPLAVETEGVEQAHATTPLTLRSTMVSQSRPSSARISSPCSLNSGARPAGAGLPSYCTGAATRRNGTPVDVLQPGR